MPCSFASMISMNLPETLRSTPPIGGPSVAARATQPIHFGTQATGGFIFLEMVESGITVKYLISMILPPSTSRVSGT